MRVAAGHLGVLVLTCRSPRHDQALEPVRAAGGPRSQAHPCMLDAGPFGIA